MKHGKRIAELLLDISAVKLSIDRPFTWTSGITSPIYCDNRMLYGHPEARDFIVEALVSHIRELHYKPDVIAGTATAAIGWAAIVADRMKLPFVYVRAKAKEHGVRQQIEGDLKEGMHVVLIEDLISTAGSAVSSVEALRNEEKAVVSDVIAIFSYELLTSIQKAQEARITIHPLSTLSTLLSVALERGQITKEEGKIAADFVKDPEHWKLV